jgi:hypothetical protein
MTTEINVDNETPINNSDKDWEEVIKKRRERDAETIRLQHEENKRLKKEADELKRQLEDLEKKAQKGTASDDELGQLQTAKKAAEQAITQGQQQGYTYEQIKSQAVAEVEWEMKQKQLESKMMDAREKDPEFAKMVDANNKLTDPNAKLFHEEVSEMAYLPNAPAVIKQLLKDPKSMAVLKAAFAERSRTSVMMVLNNLSDRLAGNEAKPQPSSYKPPEYLSDSSDDDQSFDESSYISSKY